MEASQEQKEEIIRTRQDEPRSLGNLPNGKQPFNFGIKELKRVLDRMDMPKAEKNRTIKMYKERLYQRVEEVRAKMEEKLKLPETGEENATDK